MEQTIEYLESRLARRFKERYDETATHHPWGTLEGRLVA